MAAGPRGCRSLVTVSLSTRAALAEGLRARRSGAALPDRPLGPDDRSGTILFNRHRLCYVAVAFKSAACAFNSAAVQFQFGAAPRHSMLVPAGLRP
jgi:hypothetical protein